MTTSDPVARRPAVSVEAWVKTTSTRGGRIVGYGDSATGTATSGNTDRVLYLDSSGRVNFAINDGSYRTIYSRSGINDGQWHHVVGTVGGAGMQLFVDGKRVGRDQTLHHAQDVRGLLADRRRPDHRLRQPADRRRPGRQHRRRRRLLRRRCPRPTSRRTTWPAAEPAAWTAAPTDAYGAAVSGQPARSVLAAGRVVRDPRWTSADGGTTATCPARVTRNQTGAITGNAATAFERLERPDRGPAGLERAGALQRGAVVQDHQHAGRQADRLRQRDERPEHAATTGTIVMQSNGQAELRRQQRRADVRSSRPTPTTTATGTMSSRRRARDGMKLWVDTQLVGDQHRRPRPRATSATGASAATRPSGSTTSNYIAGTIDEVAVYPTRADRAEHPRALRRDWPDADQVTGPRREVTVGRRATSDRQIEKFRPGTDSARWRFRLGVDA